MNPSEEQPGRMTPTASAVQAALSPTTVPTAREAFEAFQPQRVGAYTVTKTGIVVENDEAVDRITSTYVYVRAAGRDVEGENWSALVDWMTPDAEIREWVIPYTRLCGDWGTLSVELGRRGLIVQPMFQRDLRSYLIEAMQHPATPRVRLVQRIGFFPLDPRAPDGAYGFMLPDGPILPEGADIEPVLYMPPLPSQVEDAYAVSGTHEEWSRVVGEAAGNDLWVFDVVAGIAAVMLDVARCDNFGIHTWGATSSGKTTGARVAMSALGRTSASSASDRGTLWQTWTATSNGVELLAVSHSGGALMLDEIGATPQGVGLNVYALLHGRTKARMTEYGGMRQQFTWRLLVLSTGEVSLVDRIEQDGQRRAMGGELVRFLGIPIDELPVDESMSHAEGEALANRLKAMVGEHYGHAGRHFVRALLSAYPNYQELSDAVRTAVDATTQDLIAQFEQEWVLKPPHRRALRQFALLHVCGCAACDYGSIPFSVDDVDRAITSAIRAWLKGFPGTDESDRLPALLRSYFYCEDRRYAVDLATENRREWEDGGWMPDVFYHDGKVWFSPEAFEVACEGQPPKRVAKALDRLGILHRHDGDGQLKAKITVWPSVFNGARYYALHARGFLSEADIEDLCDDPRNYDRRY